MFHQTHLQGLGIEQGRCPRLRCLGRGRADKERARGGAGLDGSRPDRPRPGLRPW